MKKNINIIIEKIARLKIKKMNIRRNYFNTASKNIISDNYENDEKNKKVLMPSLSSNEIYSIGNN